MRSMTFFTHRVVHGYQQYHQTCGRILQDTELFLQVYYKLNTYICADRTGAGNRENQSGETEISVWDAAQQCEGVDGYVKGSIRSIQTHMQHLLEEPAGAGYPSNHTVSWDIRII